MKKLLLAILPILVAGCSYAQNIFPTTGNVGIGTTSPMTLLSVNGNSSFTGTITNSGLTGGAAGNFVVNGGSGLFVTRTAAQVLSDIGGIANTGATNQILYYNRVNKLGADPNFYYEDGSKLLRVTQLWPSALQYNVGNFTSGAITQILVNTNTDNNVKTASSIQLKSWAGYYTSGDSPIFGKLSVSGNVGIGTTQPDKALTVNGTIHATEVLIDQTVPHPDYVFDKDYDLASLKDVKAYIDKNHHLPEIPSAAQVTKEGINLGEMNAKLLKKIEELTLYLIEKDKELKNEKLKNKLQQQQLNRINKKLHLN